MKKHICYKVKAFFLRFCIKVKDMIRQFETVSGRLHVTSTERADCDLSIQALTALIYGAHDPGDFAIRGWGNPSPDLQAVMRTVFPPMLPFMHEMF